jgi:hypothetical protein
MSCDLSNLVHKNGAAYNKSDGVVFSFEHEITDSYVILSSATVNIPAASVSMYTCNYHTI